MKNRSSQGSAAVVALALANLGASLVALGSSYFSVAEVAPPGLAELAEIPEMRPIAIRRARAEGVAFAQRLGRQYSVVVVLCSALCAGATIAAFAAGRRTS